MAPPRASAAPAVLPGPSLRELEWCKLVLPLEPGCFLGLHQTLRRARGLPHNHPFPSFPLPALLGFPASQPWSLSPELEVQKPPTERTSRQATRTAQRVRHPLSPVDATQGREISPPQSDTTAPSCGKPVGPAPPRPAHPAAHSRGAEWLLRPCPGEQARSLSGTGPCSEAWLTSTLLPPVLTKQGLGWPTRGKKNHRSLSCSCPRSMRPPRNRNGAPPSPGTQQVVPWLLRSQLPDGRDAQFSAHHLRPPQGRDQISGRRKGKKRQAPCAQPCTSPSAEARRNPFCTRSFLVTGNPRGIWSLPSWVPRCSRMQICGGILPAAAHAPQRAAR